MNVIANSRAVALAKAGDEAIHVSLYGLLRPFRPCNDHRKNFVCFACFVVKKDWIATTACSRLAMTL